MSNLGNIYLHLKRFDDAIKYFSKAKLKFEEIDNEYNKNDQAELLYLLGLSYYYKQDGEQAVNHFLDAMELF